jgi:hypothetical protein
LAASRRRALVQRTVLDYKPGNAGPYKDTKKGEVQVLEAHPPEEPEIMVLVDATGTKWIHRPAKDPEKEIYREFDEALLRRMLVAMAKRSKAGGTEQQREQRKKNKGKQVEQDAAAAQAEAKRIEEELRTGTWKTPRRNAAERADRWRVERGELARLLQRGLDGAGRSPALRARIEGTFRTLLEKLPTLEYTPDLRNKVDEVVQLVEAVAPASPSASPSRSAKPPDLASDQPIEGEQKRTNRDHIAKKLSQALAELDYAARIVERGDLRAPFVLGARSRMTAGGAVAEAEPEHGDLPPLHVENLEADAYYQTADGVLHVDEVKDTPAALAAKVKEGGQVRRQLEWLDLPVRLTPTSVARKTVHYYVANTKPDFAQLLRRPVQENLNLLEVAGAAEPIITLGNEELSLLQLSDMLAKYESWNEKSREALQRDPDVLEDGKPKRSKIDDKYFDSLESTRATLEGDSLEPRALDPSVGSPSSTAQSGPIAGGSPSNQPAGGNRQSEPATTRR